MNAKLQKIAIRMSQIAVYAMISCQSILMVMASETNAHGKYLNELLIPTEDDQFPKVKDEIEEQRSISGVITNEDGEGLPGATIREVGTTNGTITDVEGRFTLSVDEGATISISFVGYETREIEVGTQEVINVSLDLDVGELDDVVVVGYGTARKSEITGSVGIATAEDLRNQPSENVLQRLRGKVAGVNIFTNSGAPTGNNRVLIRGIGTINASTDPLYVVDGVQMEDITFLNPNDIQSIEVLKDASSAAIYGARGANGVILITTQSGLKTEGTQIEFASNLRIGQLDKRNNTQYDPMNSREFMEVMQRSYDNAPLFENYAPGDEPELILNNSDLFDSQGNPLYNTDWMEEATRTTVSHDYQLSIRSSKGNSSSGLFINYNDTQGLFINSSMKRYGGKFVYEASPKEWLTLGTVMNLFYIKENDSPGNGHWAWPIQRYTSEFPPIFPVKWPDGTYTNSLQTTGTTFAFEANHNPVAVLSHRENLTNRLQLFGNTYAKFHFSPDLTFTTQLGINDEIYKNKQYFPTWLIGNGFPRGDARINNSRTFFWQFENYLNYNKIFGEHSINAVVGASWQQKSFDTDGIRVRDFPNDFFRYNNIDAGATPSPPTSDVFNWTMNSYFGRGTYTYRGKYSATVTARLDGSSRFGENNKYGLFPSGGISWLVSEEGFLSNNDFIDLLRVRTSYGVTGNTEIGNFNSLATISSGTILVGGALQPTSSVSRLANPDIRWEKSQLFDVGVHLAILNYGITLEATFYNKRTVDLLLDRPVPSQTGFETVVDNIGEIQNTGVELLLTTSNIRTANFHWTTILNANYNKNRVVKLGVNDEDIFPGPRFISGSETILRVGEPVASFWGFERFTAWGTDQAAEAAEVGAVPGMKRYSETKQITGNGMPDWRGSLINRINYGNFDFTFDLQFSVGADVLQEFIATYEDYTGISNGSKTILYESWTPENQDTKVGIIRNAAFNGATTVPDTHWVADGSFLRGNLIGLGYSFDRNVLEKLGLGSLWLQASVENAFLIHSPEFAGYDPDVGGGAFGDKTFSQNIFFYQYPKPRTYALSLNVQF